MKKSMILWLAIALLTGMSSVMAYEKSWSIGNSDVSAVTYVKASKSTSLIEAEAGGYAMLFGRRADAFLINARGEETCGYCSAKIGPYSYSSSSSITKSWSGTFLDASASFTVGIIPVTVGGKVGASASITLSVGIKYVKVSATVAGTGSASAAAGIPGWKAGVKCDFDPLLGGQFDALSTQSATFTVQALHIHLKAFVDYLFGIGHYEKQIASYGPLYSQTIKLW